MSLFADLFNLGKVTGGHVSGKLKSILWTIVGLTTNEKAGDAEHSSDNAVFASLGCYGIPDTPNSDGYCQPLSVRVADKLIPFAARDLRIERRVNPAAGQLGMGHYSGSFVDLQWNDGRNGGIVSISAAHLDSGGSVDSAHYLVLDTTDSVDGNSVTLAHRLGQGVVLNKDGDAVLKSANGQHTVSATNNGVIIAGKMNFFGGIVAGTSSAAQSLTIFAPLKSFIDAQNAIIQSLVAAVNTLTSGAAVTPAQIAALTIALAAFEAGPGECTTVKGSPT